MATRTSASAGVFTAGTTWVGGVAPVTGDSVVIGAHAITGCTGYSITSGKTLSIAGGSLAGNDLTISSGENL